METVKKDTGYNKSFKKLVSYGLSTAACISVMECVVAYQNYDNLPIASKESIQAISDAYNVTFHFTPLKRGKICLNGISTKTRSSYLYNDDTLKDRTNKKHWKDNTISYHLYPGSDNIFTRIEG